MNKYYCTPSKTFDTLLCTIGWFAIQMGLIATVSKMAGKIAELIYKEEKDSHSDDEKVCTSCEDHSQ